MFRKIIEELSSESNIESGLLFAEEHEIKKVITKKNAKDDLKHLHIL